MLPHIFNLAFLLIERCCRFCVEDAPRCALALFPGIGRGVSLLFMYVCFQSLAICWCFSLHAFSNLAQLGVGLLSHISPASNGGFMQRFVHFRGFITFYSLYASARCVYIFTRSLWILGWESVAGFPAASSLFHRERHLLVWKPLVIMTIYKEVF